MKPRGFTLLELAVAVGIIAVLALVVLDRLRFYQEAAEKAAVEQTVEALRSALRLRVAEQLLRGGAAEVAALERANPMELLAEPPQNYLGLRHAAKTGEVPGGNWYFDLQDRQLVYVVHLGNHFVPDRLGRKQVRYELRRIEKTPQEQASATAKEIQEIILAEAVPYRWF